MALQEPQQKQFFFRYQISTPSVTPANVLRVVSR